MLLHTCSFLDCASLGSSDVHTEVECVQYGYAVAVGLFQPTCLALNGLHELFLTGRTYDQRYSQPIYDSERYGLTEFTDLDARVHEAGDMHWCAGSSYVPD